MTIFILVAVIGNGYCPATDSDIRAIPFEDVLTILVSIFLLLRDERKARESVRLT